MAGEGPDPKTFSSWEEAFQHPLPTVRGMEKQLRRDIDSNKEKLRSLVGASYRDLLNTAESIIEMNSQMHNVETHLAEIGQKCNTRLLVKKGANLRTWQDEVNSSDSARYTLASQLAVLRSCPDVISRLLKSDGSVLLAAKILVLSRLLHAKLLKRDNPPPYLETLRSRLATLRRKLLARIDRRFKSLDVSRDALVEAMCAFALATSSSTTDVVRHFHHLRLETIAECMDKDSETQNSTLQALQLYVKTLRDTQALVPAQLANGLERLKMVPIFKSQDLYHLLELNLDVHDRWIGDDIKAFTPYIRHDDLSKVEAERLLRQWAKTAVSRFLEGLKANIADERDPMRLAQLRKEVLELWLSQHHHSLGIDSAETLDGLRNVFNDQAGSIIRKRVSDLEGVGASIWNIIKDWRATGSDVALSLWDPSTIAMDATNGGKRFSESITDRLQGTNEPIRTASVGYTRWLGGISEIENMIKALRETKWNNVVDDIEDDEELLDNKQVLLSEDDPQSLQNDLANALRAAFARLEDFLEPASLFADQSMHGPKAVFILRIWRDLRQRLPGSYHKKAFGISSIVKITTSLVEFTLKAPLRSCSNRLRRAAKGRALIAKPLWEGNPALPVLPSPWAYRLLLEVVESMTELGPDIWTPSTSRELRNGLSRGLKAMLQAASPIAEASKEVKANGHINGKTNGENEEGHEDNSAVDKASDIADQQGEEKHVTSTERRNGTHVNGDGNARTEDGGDVVRDRKVQRLFDVLYLDQVCATSNSNKENETVLAEVQVSLETELELEAKSLERVQKDAREYWKRTKLLFALIHQ